MRADIASYPLAHLAGKVEGLIASPPCQSFSLAGKRQGLDDPRGQLVWEPVRWAEALMPEWVACEQVPPVLPIWKMEARRLEDLGYHTWTGILSSEQFGVPQVRKRAFLLASRVRRVGPPAPTHQAYDSRRKHAPQLGLLPWVSMAEALGWPDDAELEHPRGAGMVERHGPRSPRRADAASMVVTEKARLWVVRTGNNSMKHNRNTEDMVPYERPISEPSPTVDCKAGNAWVLHTNRGQDATGTRQTRPAPAPAPAPALSTKSGGQWVFDRPATTVAADPRLGDPGHKNRDKGERQFGPDAIRLTVRDTLILQGFDPDLPVAGTRTAQFRQVGNAVAVPVATAILSVLTGVGR